MATEKKKLVFNPTTGQFDVSLDVSAMAETADLAAYQLLSEKAAANGYASLDSGGKVPSAQLPSSVMQYQGQYNAATDTPSLSDGVGDAGDVYEVTVAGSNDFGAGSISFNVGDWVVYNGSIWQKSINSNEVVSVNGLTGAVTLDTDDISEGSSNLYYTTARFDAQLATKSTDNLAEGVTNLYYTNARAKAAAVADVITDGVTDVAPSQNAVFDALALKATNPMTTAGDIIFGLTGGVPARLASGGNLDVLTSGATPQWTTPQAGVVASSIVSRNAAANIAARTFSPAFNTTVTSGGTTTLTSNSNGTQVFTGTSNQTLVMPLASTLANVGTQYWIKNKSTGIITVNSSGGNLIQTMAPSSSLNLTQASSAGTTAASWVGSYVIDGGGVAAATVFYPAYPRKITSTSTAYHSYWFAGTGVSATAGAVYSHNGGNYQVTQTVASSSSVHLVGVSNTTLPLTSGTLTKVSGTGDTTITFASYRAPLYVIGELVGGGGAGSGSGVGAASGGFPGTTTTWTSVASVSGGLGATRPQDDAYPGAGGNTINILSLGQEMVQMNGNSGTGAFSYNVATAFTGGSAGGAGYFGGGSGQGGLPAANSGGGGAGGETTATAVLTGKGGGAGAYAKVLVPNPASLTVSWSMVIGLGGTGGPAGTSGFAGKAGADGMITWLEVFQ
jgi:hypothetical protein